MSQRRRSKDVTRGGATHLLRDLNYNGRGVAFGAALRRLLLRALLPLSARRAPYRLIIER